MIVQPNAHVGIVCRDLEKSIAFYEKFLGLKEKFTRYYGDMIPKDPVWLAKVPQERIDFLKTVENVKWIVYMEFTEGLKGYFIELFNELDAHIENLPSKEKFGLNHIDIVVDDIQAFYQELVDKGAEEYIFIKPGSSICRSYTMWLRDPDGNEIEVHQYTDISMQVIGRELPEGMTWIP